MPAAARCQGTPPLLLLLLLLRAPHPAPLNLETPGPTRLCHRAAAAVAVSLQEGGQGEAGQTDTPEAGS